MPVRTGRPLGGGVLRERAPGALRMSPSVQLQRVLDALAARGLKPSEARGQWLARCPAHDDTRASLSLADGNRAVTVHCHAGCSFGAIAAALSIEPRGFFYDDKSLGKPKRTIGATYEYRDGAIKLRFVPKSFGWVRNGKPGLDGLKPNDLLFGEELLSERPGTPVLIVEGEKAALSARERFLSFIVVAGAGGAGWRPTRRVLALLHGRRVFIWPDADPPGWTWARHLAEALAVAAAAVSVVVVADVPPGFDAADFAGTFADLTPHVYGPKAIPADAVQDRPARFVSVALGSDDLVGLTPLTEQLYWRLVTHPDGGIVRVVRTTPRDLARMLGRNLSPQDIAHVARALGDLERRGLIVQGEGWIYVRRGVRFAPLKGGPVAAAAKFLARVPGSIRAAILDDEPWLRTEGVSSSPTDPPPKLHGPGVLPPQRYVHTSRVPGCVNGRDATKRAEEATTSGIQPHTLPGDKKERTTGRTAGRTAWVAASPPGEDDGRSVTKSEETPTNVHLRPWTLPGAVGEIPFDPADCPQCGRDSCDGGACRTWSDPEADRP